MSHQDRGICTEQWDQKRDITRKYMHYACCIIICCDPRHHVKSAMCCPQIFPLNIVAFPASPCPLHIFEARYRVLFSTLLKGADDLEEGLIQDDKSFAGTRRFGMCWVCTPSLPLSASCT